MKPQEILAELDRLGDVVRLNPQIVGRFYGDNNRLGQRAADAGKPDYHSPERWIASSTPAVNPPGIPSGGVSTCGEPALTDGGKPIALRDLLKTEEVGPRLLGEKRYEAHGRTFRVLIKLLDAVCPIPFHVHADDAFVTANGEVYPNETFGKDEAYHFLDSPKGECPYTHVGLYDGVEARDVIEAMKRGTDHLLELSPGAYQNFGEGFIVKAGLLHRPGTALTLEIQQPSDVYTMFQTDFGGEPLPAEALHPGFDSIEAAAEAVINWDENRQEGLLESVRLRPEPVTPTLDGGQADWIFPPDRSAKFSGMRLTVETDMKLPLNQPCVIYVWRGKGKLNGRVLDGRGGPVGDADEFFVGKDAADAGVDLTNTGDEPLVAFALFAAALS